MFPTETSSNVEMVGCVSEATGSCMEKLTAGKVQEQGGVFHDSVTTRSTFAGFKTHTLYMLSPSLHLATSVAKSWYTHAH